MKRVLLVSTEDPTNKKVWSGTQYSFYQQLKKYFEVKILVVDNPRARSLDYRRMRFLTFGKQYTVFGFINSYMSSRRVQKELGKDKYDVAFVFDATNIPFIRTTTPIIYYTDATIHLMQHYQWNFRWPLNWEADVIQRKCLEKSTIVLAASMWAIRDMVDYYGIDNKKCKLCRLGANAKIEIISTKKENNNVNIVFVGTNWKNKGGDLALESFCILREMDRNHHYHLHIVGSKPDREIEDCNITFYGFLDRNDPEQEQKHAEVFKNGDIFLLPTKAECAGIVFCEASAYGIPIVTYDTGGVGDYVINGVNGFRLPMGSSGQQFASKMLEIIMDSALRKKLSEGGQKLYNESLNWDVAGKIVKDTIDSISK